jgi:hypothetical protein
MPPSNRDAESQLAPIHRLIHDSRLSGVMTAGGAGGLRKTPKWALGFQFTLVATSMFFLVLDVFSDRRFVQTHGNHTISTWPKTTAKQRSFRYFQFAMDPNGPFALRIRHRRGNTVFRWNRQQHMRVIRHRMAYPRSTSF